MNGKICALDEFKEFLKQLVESGRLEGTELGVAKLVLGKGYGVLSPEQMKVFDRMIDTNVIENCQRCGVPIPSEEMFIAIDNGGYCCYCQHMMEKIEKE